MYNFIDACELQGEKNLPAESFSINGIILEDEVIGYRTLSVSGRELISDEVVDKTIGRQNGSIYLHKRHLPREIQVKYQLISKDPYEFRNQFNRLNQILNFENAKIIFNDETDKYFLGTKSDVDLPEAGRLAFTSYFSIYCPKPYKYCVGEKTVNGAGVITLRNEGTLGAPVKIYSVLGKNATFVDYTIDNRRLRIERPFEIGDTVYIDMSTLNVTVNAKSVWDDGDRGMEPLLVPVGVWKLNATDSNGDISATVAFRERWM